MLAAAALAGCREQEVAQNAPAPATDNGSAPAPAVVLPRPEPPLDREALLIAVVRARSAAATGRDDRAAQAELDGARFTFRLRFCGPPPAPAEAAGPAPAKATRPASREAPQPAGLTLSFDPEARRVALRAAPDLALDHPVVSALAAGQFEQVEGFWIPQPWLLAPACLPDDAAVPEPTVGIAQFFGSAEARTGRRDGRAYEARETLPETAPTRDGMNWDLVLTGRLRHLRDGRAILCTPVAAGQPACLIAAEFERVTIENAASGEQLAEWSRG